MKYFRDLVIGGRFGLRFKKYWHMGRHCYALMLTEEEFDRVQDILNRVTDEHRCDCGKDLDTPVE